jgi:hypothetical protein
MWIKADAPKEYQFVLHKWHPSCYKPSDKSWMRKRMDGDYEKRNISDVISDIDIP